MRREQGAVRSGNDRALDAVLLSDVTGNHSPRSAVQMIRSAVTALVGTAVFAALAGCAQPQAFALPELTPQGTVPGVQVYPGYGNGYGYGIGGGYGYPNGYRPGLATAMPTPITPRRGPTPMRTGTATTPTRGTSPTHVTWSYLARTTTAMAAATADHRRIAITTAMLAATGITIGTTIAARSRRSSRAAALCERRRAGRRTGHRARQEAPGTP